VRLARASAGAVGELLTVLYPPAGPTGTGQRYTLIYPSSLECDIAADFALQLDVATVEGAALQLPEESQAAFAFGVGVLYATPRGHADEVDRLRLAEAGLVKALNAPAQPARIRWAAAMMAAGVCAERLREYDKAEGYCLEAAKVVEADSLEQMAAWYALARAYVQNGKPDVAQETLTNLITTFEAFAATEVFGRARQALTDLDRKRPR